MNTTLITQHNIFNPHDRMVLTTTATHSSQVLEELLIADGFEVELYKNSELQLQIDNTSRAIERYLIEYDTYLKLNGIDGNGITCELYVLNTNDLSEAVMIEYFELVDFKANNKMATFTLGTTSLFNKQYPPRKMYANFCSFKFKDNRCGYVGAITTCNKTLSDCRARNNSVRYGGMVGTGSSIRV